MPINIYISTILISRLSPKQLMLARMVRFKDSLKGNFGKRDTFSFSFRCVLANTDKSHGYTGHPHVFYRYAHSTWPFVMVQKERW